MGRLVYQRALHPMPYLRDFVERVTASVNDFRSHRISSRCASGFSMRTCSSSSACKRTWLIRAAKHIKTFPDESIEQSHKIGACRPNKLVDLQRSDL